MTPNYVIKLRDGVVVAEQIQLTLGQPTDRYVDGDSRYSKEGPSAKAGLPEISPCPLSECYMVVNVRNTFSRWLHVLYVVCIGTVVYNITIMCVLMVCA